MATGLGKTIAIAMVIAWHILNKVANPQDARFSKNVLVIAPGLTVKKRLSVLELSAEEYYYEAFDIVPSALVDIGGSALPWTNLRSLLCEVL